MTHLAKDYREVRVKIDLGQGRSTFGTCDRFVVYSDNTADAIDYKTGYGKIDDAEINIQGQAYVLGLFQKFPQVTEITMWFLVPARDEASMHTFTRDDIPAIRLRISTIIERAECGGHYNPQPGVCDYCGNQGRCPALANKVLTIAQRYQEDGLPIPESVHGSEQDDPVKVAALMSLVPIMESWANGVRKRATEMAVDQGMELPGFKVIEMSRWIPRRVHPQTQRSSCVGRINGIEVASTVGSNWNWYRARSGKFRPHRIGRIADGRIQHGVAIGRAQAKPMREPGDELLAANACGNLFRTNADAEFALHPTHRRFAIRGKADRCWIAALACRCGERFDDNCWRRVEGVAYREVDYPTLVRRRDRLERIEPIVGIGRRCESGGHERRV